MLLNLAALAVLVQLVLSVGDPVAATESSVALGGGAPRALPEADADDPRPAGGASAIASPEVAARVRAIVRKHVASAGAASKGRVRAADVRVAVHVRELGAGDAQLALEADRAQPPASNMKLVTTAAALVLLGPGWHFETAFEAGGPIVGGSLRGDLVVRAAGDPLYDPDAAGSVDHLLEPVVRDLRARGIDRVEGDLVLDEAGFAAPAPAPGWPGEGQLWAEYCALAGGLSANRGCLTATVRPARRGGRARVVVEPRHHGLPEDFAVDTVASGALVVRLDARGRAGVRVKGSIPSNVSRWSDSFAHPDPVALFGSALAGALAEGGVRLEGTVRRERGARGGQVVARLRTPLTATLHPINTDSNNGVADQLFLAMGHAARGAGTRAAAAAATRAALDRLGLPADGLVQVDGSGLSRDNRVTARQVSALVAAVLEMGDPAASLYRSSLAVAGESGTLAKRMRADAVRGKVQAKTGFISGVSALAGVARSDAGREYVFSILVEYPNVDGLNTRCWKPMQDEICDLLVGLVP